MALYLWMSLMRTGIASHIENWCAPVSPPERAVVGKLEANMGEWKYGTIKAMAADLRKEGKPI